jgi:hypothetical protein
VASLIALLGLVTIAQAEPAACPDPEPLLRSAENDALNYFLADAKGGLVGVVDAWGCGPRAESGDMGLYFRVRGLLAYLDNDAALARRAFFAAKAHGAAFSADYGTEAQALWDTAAAPDAAPTELVLKGRLEGEWLAIDGVEGSSPVDAGYHVLQVGTGQTAGSARVIDAEGGEQTVVFPRVRTAPVAVAPAEPVAVVPVAGGDGETQGVEEVQRADGAGSALQAPFLRESGALYVDGAGTSVHWRDDLLPLAARDAEGLRARGRYRSNAVAQGVALTVTPAAEYGAYLFGWDATTGNNLSQGASWGATAGFAALGVTTIVWEAVLLTKRPRRRAEIEEAAGRVAQSVVSGR